VKQDCVVNIISANNFDIQVATEIPKGNVELILYGLESVNSNSDITIKTFVQGGKTDPFLIDQSGSPLTLTWAQYDFDDIDTAANREDTEILKMRNIQL
jgi:hypothetical protein